MLPLLVFSKRRRKHGLRTQNQMHAEANPNLTYLMAYSRQTSNGRVEDICSFSSLELLTV